MGFVQIPPSTPSGPRFTAMRAELNEAELRTVVRHMRSALEHALEPNPSAALVRPQTPSLVASASTICNHACMQGHPSYEHRVSPPRVCYLMSVPQPLPRLLWPGAREGDRRRRRCTGRYRRRLFIRRFIRGASVRALGSPSVGLADLPPDERPALSLRGLQRYSGWSRCTHTQPGVRAVSRVFSVRRSRVANPHPTKTSVSVSILCVLQGSRLGLLLLRTTLRTTLRTARGPSARTSPSAAASLLLDGPPRRPTNLLPNTNRPNPSLLPSRSIPTSHLPSRGSSQLLHPSARRRPAT